MDPEKDRFSEFCSSAVAFMTEFTGTPQNPFTVAVVLAALRVSK